MARIQTRIAKDGTKRYIVKYLDPEGHDRSKSFTKLLGPDGAQAFKAKTEVSLNQGTYLDPTAGRMTFGQYVIGHGAWPGWLATQTQWSDETRRLRQGILNGRLLPLLGERPLASIQRSDVSALVVSLSQEVGPSWLRQVYQTLGAILKSAVLDGRIPSSPAVGIKLPPMPKGKITCLTPEQVSRLVAAAPPRYAGLIRLAAETGMRWAELNGLTIDHIDWLPRPRIRVARQWHRGRRGFGATKTASSNRVVGLHAETARWLAAYLAEFPPLEPEGFVFHTGRRPVRDNSFYAKVWNPLVASLGFERRWTFHDLRHYHVSSLLMQGETPRYVAERVGHKNTSVTLDTYGHFIPQDDEREQRSLARTVIAV